MNKKDIWIFYIDAKKMGNKVFQKELGKISGKISKKILKFNNIRDQKLQLASEYLKNLYFKELFRSISHSNGICGIAISGEKVGLDIQSKKTKINWNLISKRAKKYCDFANKDDFLEFWTKAEATIKCASTSKKDVSFFDVEIEKNHSFVNKKKYYTYTQKFLKNYHIALCSKIKINNISLKEIKIY